MSRKLTLLTGKRAVAAAGGLFLFLIISYFVITRDTLTFDTVIREYIYTLRSSGLTAVLRAITYLGNWETVTLICLTFLLIPRTRLTFGVPLSASAILATLIQKALKVSFHRARPDLSLHLITQGGYSFPSGHSFTVLIFYGMMIFLCRSYLKNKSSANQITMLLSCLIALIGFSRIYLGVHFPTDVLGGWSIGFCVLIILTGLVENFKMRR
jgi:Membrane-associated phospholipid phosphatase